MPVSSAPCGTARAHASGELQPSLLVSIDVGSRSARQSIYREMAKHENSGGWVTVLSVSRAVTEDRCRSTWTQPQAPSAVKPPSGGVDRRDRFGMNRFVENTKFLGHQTMVVKLLFSLQTYKWSYVESYPLMSFTGSLVTRSH